MNKVIIECDELVAVYKLSKDSILKQLQSIKTVKGKNSFITAYNDDLRYTLIG